MYKSILAIYLAHRNAYCALYVPLHMHCVHRVPSSFSSRSSFIAIMCPCSFLSSVFAARHCQQTLIQIPDVCPVVLNNFRTMSNVYLELRAIVSDLFHCHQTFDECLCYLHFAPNICASVFSLYCLNGSSFDTFRLFYKLFRSCFQIILHFLCIVCTLFCSQ